MPLPLIDMQHLVATCAPEVAPQTLLSIAKVESGFDPLAIGVNWPAPMRLHPHTKEEAIATATRLIAAGGNVDLGVSQINSRNLGWLGLMISNAFDACRNLAASARIIATDYGRAAPTSGGEQAALRTALSYYNTGDPRRGYRNGYVAKVMVAAGQVVPALTPQGDLPPAAAPSLAPATPAWDVFAQRSQPTSGFVFNPQLSGDDR